MGDNLDMMLQDRKQDIWILFFFFVSAQYT
jgi:hypothetical protein